MDTPTIEAMNVVIARFMGAKVMDDLTVSNYADIGIPSWAFQFNDFDTIRVGGYEYNSSWDWLMPVIEKAMNMRVKSSASYNPNLMFRIEIVNGYTKIEGTGQVIFYNASIEGSMLMATYKAVYQFIQWYNLQKAADTLLNLPEETAPKGMPLPATDPFTNKQKDNE